MNVPSRAPISTPAMSTSPAPPSVPTRLRTLRGLLLGYAIYAAGDSLRLLLTSAPSPIVVTAIAWLAASAAWATLLFVVFPPPSQLGRVNRFTATATIACFVASFAAYTLWVGILIAATALVLGRPRLSRLSASARRLWLTIHVVSSVGWLGAGMVMVIFSYLGVLDTGGTLGPHAYAVIHFLDLTLIVPLVLISIVTGVVLSLGTKWGLVQHSWVLAKLVIALAIVAFATAFEHFWVIELAERLASDANADPGRLGWQLAATLTVFLVGLLIATILSIYKPWGRTRWGVRALQDEQASRRQHAGPDSAAVGRV
jgi:hypothetical protein